MDDFTKDYRFQRILLEAAQYRALSQIFDSMREREPELNRDQIDRFKLAPAK